MKKTITAMAESFYSGDLYREVYTSWKGLGFKYLFVAIFVTLLFLTIGWTVKISKISLKSPYDIEYMLPQLPNMVLRDGRLYADAPQPHYIKDKNGQVIAVIDTIGKTTKMNGWILATADTIYYRVSKYEIKSWKYGKDANYEITKEKVKELLDKALKYAKFVPIILLPFFLIFGFIGFIIKMFIYGVFGLLISKIAKAGLRYTECVRLACVAATPAFIIDTVSNLLTLSTISAWITFPISMAYMFFGAKSIAKING